MARLPDLLLPLMVVLALAGCQSTSDVKPGDARKEAGRWSLIAPPFGSFENSSRGGPRVLDDAPLSKWSIIDRFESAEACEQYRRETIRFLTREDQNPTFSRAGAMLNQDRAMLTRCIRSNDPSLRGFIRSRIRPS